MMDVFRILFILCTLHLSVYSVSDHSVSSPVSDVSTPIISNQSQRSTYSPSDSSDSRSSRSKSMSNATSASPTQLSATQSETSSPGRTIAPGNAEYHEKMHPYYDKKAQYHKVTHDYYKADKKEPLFSNLHNDEATSSYKKARKHEHWANQVGSGKMQPGKKTEKDVPSSGCPSPPCCNGQAHCLRKNRNYTWPHKNNSRRLLPVKASKKRGKRIFESDLSQGSSDVASTSSSGPSTSSRPTKRKKI